MSFTDMLGWIGSFYVLTPITNCTFLEHLVVRLKNSKVYVDENIYANDVMMATARLEGNKEGQKYFVSCSCATYKHYLLCTHSFAHALKTGLVQYPSGGLDPRKFITKGGGAATNNSKPKRKKDFAASASEKALEGRPARARRGGARDKEH
jgi:hypothetical protein